MVDAPEITEFKVYVKDEEKSLLDEQTLPSKKAFRKRWWRFDAESDGKIPIIPRWGYTRLSGTGQPIALGLTFSFGLEWGAFVVNLPMFEFTLGYVPSPMTLR